MLALCLGRLTLIHVLFLSLLSPTVSANSSPFRTKHLHRARISSLHPHPGAAEARLPSSRRPVDFTTVKSASTTSGPPSGNNTSGWSSPAGVSRRSSSDLDTIRERRISMIVDDVSAASVQSIPNWLSSIGEDGRWPDSEVDYTSGCAARRANWPAEDHWGRIMTMAAAWHGGVEGADQYANSVTVLDAVSRAMDYWFANDFTDAACLASGGGSGCPCGTPGLWNTNWFSNIIGIPELVGNSCLLLGAPTLTPSQLNGCSRITTRAFGTFDSGAGFLTGANVLDIANIGIMGGLLTGDADVVVDGYRRIHAEVVVHNELAADGIRPDGSFGQHGGLIYNGNYGKDYTNDVLELEIAAAGTPYSAVVAGTGSQSAFETLLEGDLWMIYRNIKTNVLHWDFSVLPRFITFPVADGQATSSIDIDVPQIAQLGGSWGSEVLQSVASSLQSGSRDANSGRLRGNRMFFDNDYMVQRGTGYVSTLRMYSSRTLNSECTNSENPFGFHLSDGTLYTYLEGDEYEDIAGVWDWNLIPGTTTDYAATPLSCDKTKFRGVESFVGGASDGTIGAAAMRYANPYTGSLSFQKAWFFLQDDVQHVMIPHAQSSAASANHPLISVLDQKRHSGPVFVNGVPLVHGGGNFTGAHSLWHDGVGYTFDNATGSRIAVDFGPRSGDWSAIGISSAGVTTADLFSAWIDHGAEGGPVAYTAFPATQPAEFAFKGARARATLRTLRNDADVSAVYDAAHRTLAAVFWNAAGGEVAFTPSLLETQLTVAASAGSIVLYKLDEGTITVADPTQQLAQIELTVRSSGLGLQPKGVENGRAMSVVLPSGGLAGQSTTHRM